MKHMTKEEYKKYVDEKSQNSPLLKDMFFAFVIGGIVCTIGQWLMNIYIGYGVEKVMASTMTSCSMVVLSALFTGFGLYGKIAKRGGAGTLVPITGFANAIAAPAIEFKSEGFIMGVGAKMFVIAGPVIVYGLAASAIAGIVYYFMG